MEISNEDKFTKDILKTYKKYQQIARDPFISEQDKMMAIAGIKIFDELFGNIIRDENFEVKTWDDLVIRDQNINFLVNDIPGFEKYKKRIIAEIQITNIRKYPRSIYGELIGDDIIRNSNKSKYYLTFVLNEGIVIKNFSTDSDLCSYARLLIFSTRQNAEDFLKYNYNLVSDYFML